MTNLLPTENFLGAAAPKTLHPKTIEEFEKIYHQEYAQELESCDQWIAWCKKRDDYYGVNFNQGLRSALIFNNIKMHQLLSILKQEPPKQVVIHATEP